MYDYKLFSTLRAIAAMSEDEFEAARAAEVYEETDFEERLEGAYPGEDLSDEHIAGLISNEARDAVIGFEVSSRSYYMKKLMHPTWPGGASGITIGIGYDIGYYRRTEFTEHWDAWLAQSDIEHLAGAIGVKGRRAKAIVSRYSGVEVPWDAANEVFDCVTRPAFARKTMRIFPNAHTLHGHCFGALFSLVYNRGTRLVDKGSGPTRKHMRNIRDHMIAGNYDRIPGELLDMRSLWPKKLSGLHKRRKAEAELFGRGLEEMVVPAPIASATDPNVNLPSEPSGGMVKLERVQAPNAFTDPEDDGDGAYYDESFEQADGGDGSVAELEVRNRWDNVRWAKSDEDSPDYYHVRSKITDATVFAFTHDDLELLINANAFAPTRENGRIVFGLRGARLVRGADDTRAMSRQVDRESLTLQVIRPNHKDFSCVLGVYDTHAKRLSGYVGSTVPCRQAVDLHQAGRSRANMVVTGCYEYVVGTHKKRPGFLRERTRKTVLRSNNNLWYDPTDEFDESRPFDNIHASFANRSADFSSWGCLTVKGNYDSRRRRHTGEWGRFRRALGLVRPGSGDHGKRFDFVLLTGTEAAIAASLREDGSHTAPDRVMAALGRIRQGARGPRVERLQRALNLEPTGRCDSKLAKAYANHQRRNLDHADAIHSPEMDERLRFNVFAPLPDPAIASTNTETHVAMNGSGSTTSTLEQRPLPSPDPIMARPDTSGRAELEALYFELGLRSRIAAQDGPQLESALPAGEAVRLEFNFIEFVGIGQRIVESVEDTARALICGDSPSEIDRQQRETIRTKLAEAKRWGEEQVIDILTDAIGTLLPVPPSVARLVARIMVERGLKFALDEAGKSHQNLCQLWAQRIEQLELHADSSPQPSQG